MLNLNPSLAQKAVETFSLFDFPGKDKLAHAGMASALNLISTGNSLFGVEDKVKDYLEESPANSIRLLFPNLDFSYSYPSMNQNKDLREHEAFLTENFDKCKFTPYREVGSLMPHLLITEAFREPAHQHKSISLRQYL